jgi:hypothetical protein
VTLARLGVVVGRRLADAPSSGEPMSAAIAWEVGFADLCSGGPTEDGAGTRYDDGFVGVIALRNIVLQDCGGLAGCVE